MMWDGVPPREVDEELEGGAAIFVGVAKGPEDEGSHVAALIEMSASVKDGSEGSITLSNGTTLGGTVQPRIFIQQYDYEENPDAPPLRWSAP